jgi:hypothetical protein
MTNAPENYEAYVLPDDVEKYVRAANPKRACFFLRYSGL